MDVEQMEQGQFKDRRGWLIFFGIIEILLGTMFVIAIGGVAASYFFVKNDNLPLNSALYLIVCYLLFSAFFFAIGIGSASVRTWARSIMIVVSWFWLIFGLFTFIGAAFLLPRALPQLYNPAGIEYKSVLSAIITMLLLFFVLAPLILVLFYSGKNVKATFMRKDPRTYWTEQRPLPVLSLFLLMSFQGVITLLSALMPVPFGLFGAVVPGVWGRLLWVLFGLAMIFAGYLSLEADSRGWLVSAGIIGVLLVSSLVTYLLGGLKGFYDALGYDTGQAALFQSLFQDFVLWLMGTMLLFYACYFAWLRKFFPKPIFRRV